MSSTLRAVALGVLLSSLAARSGAAAADPWPDGTPPAPPLDTLVDAALERAPALAAARARVEARREAETAARALPDPMLEAMIENAGLEASVGDEEMSLVGLRARQKLPAAGTRAAAGALAAGETALARAELESLERDVVAAVSTLYARIYAIDREVEALAAAAELVDLLGEVALGRYAAGEGDPEGVLKVQIEGLRVEEARDERAYERSAAAAELNRWLDRPVDTAFGRVAALPEAPATTLPAAGGEGSAAAVLRARAALDIAERRVDLARLGLRPALSAGAGLGWRGGLDPVLLLDVAVEVPLWRRRKQQPLLRSAERERDAARAGLADAEAAARAEAARLAAAWRNADRQVARYREGILPQTSAALEAARAAYLGGRGDFSTVIADFELWLEARTALARREAERFVARAEFARLFGPAAGRADR